MAVRVVVTDSCVLINLIHVGRLPLLGELPGHEFVIPDHVYEEVMNPEQRRVLDESLEHGRLKKEPLTDLSAIELYASLEGEPAGPRLARHHHPAYAPHVVADTVPLAVGVRSAPRAVLARGCCEQEHQLPNEDGVLLHSRAS